MKKNIASYYISPNILWKQKETRWFLILLLSLFSLVVNGQSYNDGSSLNFESTDGGLIVVKKSSGTYSGDIVISDVVKPGTSTFFKKVIGIGDLAFYNSTITSIYLPPTLLTIGRDAFYKCKSLSEIDIPSSVTSIGSYAFSNMTKIKTITIPSSVTSIGSRILDGCSSLQTVYSRIKDPDLISIYSDTFYNIPSDAILYVPAGTKSMYAKLSSWNNYFKEIKEWNVKESFILNIKLSGISGSYGAAYFNDWEIRWTERRFSVDEGNSATIRFTPNNGYKIKSVKVNSTDVTSSVSNNQYTINNITSDTNVEVEFGAIPTYTLSVKATGNGSASYNGNTIRNKTSTFTVTEGASATITLNPDEGYRVARVKLNNMDVTASISNNSYIISKISGDTTVEVEFEIIPSIISFADPNVKALCVANWDTDGDGELSEAEAAAVASLGDVFKDNRNITSFDELQYFTGLTSIGDQAFYYCTKLKSIIIPANVTTIGNSAFFDCESLFSVFIPKKVTSIGTGAFLDCGYGLSSIVVENGNPKYDSRNNCNAIIETATNTLLWGCNNTVIPSDVRVIGNSAFSHCLNVKSLTLPEGLTIIGNWAFYNCRSITAIDIPDNVLSIGQEAFWHCNALYSVILGKSVTSIGDCAFEQCSNLNSVVSKIQEPFNISETVFSSISTSAYLQVPHGTKNLYQVYTGWTKNFQVIKEEIYTYSLLISVTGNGSANYNGTTIRSNTAVFTVDEGISIEVALNPDEGYRVASVKLNNEDVTSAVTNNSYTITNISADANLEVAFEAIPPTTYSLDIAVIGSGSVTYNNTVIRSKTESFTVVEGSKVSVSLNPDNGYRIKSVKENDADVTAYVTNQTYIVSAVSRNTTIEVEFEAIPIVTYSMSIKTTGNGAVVFNGTSIRNTTTAFSVNEGTSPQVTLNPDEGYRVASVKLNNVDVTTNVYNNRYTIANISGDANLEVTFEVIPPTTYSLTITASGNGSVTYGSANLKNQMQTFTVNEGDNASLTISPESGYRIASVKVNNVDVTAQVVNNLYTISKIITNTTVAVTFEAIPVMVYQLSITANGNGSATYDGTAVRGETKTFAVNEGTDVTISFSPDNGNSISSVKVNGNDVTAAVVGNHYTINGMSGNVVVEVVFIEDINALTVDGVNYTVTSQSDKTICVTGGNYGQVLTVPASVNQNGQTWTVAGIENDALKGITNLTAVIWNAEATFTASVSNPNLLLYVKAEEYAPNNIRNVVVNGTASNITLVEALSGNDFYCPQAFVAQHISYTHHYDMTTGVNEARGWETIALPFDVQTITHASKGTIVPFKAWNSTSSAKPFWLYEMTGSGFVKASKIQAYTPYIISMPNNDQYTDEWLLNGNVTFEGSGVYVDVTDNLHTTQQGDRTFVPCFSNRSSYEGLYALNVNNDYSQNQTGVLEGSRFVLNMRQIHPFEAYMTTEYASRTFIPIFEESTPTDIPGIMLKGDTGSEKWHTLDGLLLQSKPTTKGVYILNGKKVVVK